MGRALVPTIALAGAALLIASMLGPALAQSPSAPGSAIDITQGPVPGQLAGMILTADDLPAGLTPGAIGDVAAFTTDAADFQTNGGLGAVQQTWTASTQAPVYMVIDFRFVFPTSAAAQAYLDAAEPVLSESAASGLSLVQGDIGVGEGYRHYAGTVVANGDTVEMHTVLFRVGPVVAKEFVGGYGTTSADVTGIAKASYGRIAAIVSPDAIASPEVVVATSPEVLATAGPDVPQTAEPARSPGADGAIHQWAVAATASSVYGPSGWSAQQATGSPDVTAHADDQRAWAPVAKDGTTEWLDLRYDQAVVPTAVAIHESFNPGFVTRVEAYDTATASWITLWQGTEPTAAGAIGTFTPTLAATDVAVDRIRVTIDTNVPDWNEIDAVELVGTPPG